MVEMLIEQREIGQMASLAASRNGLSGLVDAVHAEWGIALPLTPRRVAAGEIAFIWAGPERWMVTSNGTDDLENLLTAKLGRWAAVTDQSDSRSVWRVQGARARDSLAKLLPIDLHPRTFRTGDTALTVAAHVNLQIWQIDDLPCYEIALFRSYAAYFHHALTAAAAE